MKLTRSQNQLAQLGRAKLTDHRISVVKVSVPRSGVSHVVRSVERESKISSAIPLSLALCAVSSWDIQTSLYSLSGESRCLGCGELKAFLFTLQRMNKSGDERDVCIWLDHAGRLSIEEQENTAARAMWAADRMGIHLHLIYLFQKIDKYDHKARGWYRDWFISSHVSKRSGEFEFTDDGLESLLADNETTARGVRIA